MKHENLVKGMVLGIFLTAFVLCRDGAATVPRSVILPEGTKMVIRLGTTLDSKSTKQGELFKSELIQPVTLDMEIVLPKGSTVYGIVDEVKPIKMKIKKAKIEIVFDRIETPDGRVIPIHAGILKGFDAVGSMNKAGGAVGQYLANQAIENATAGLLMPLFVAKKARKAIQFVKKDRNVVLPAGTVLEIALKDPATVPIN